MKLLHRNNLCFKEMQAPELKPSALKAYSYKQSRFPQVPQLPTRSIVLGPSGCGKTVLLQQLILDVYKGCFERVYVFSPTVHLDQTWQAVKDYCEKHLDLQGEECFFETFEADKMLEILHVQKQVTQDMKENGKRKLWGILVIVDDFADDTQIMRGARGDTLKTLYVKGRHYGVSTIVGTQKYRLLSPVLRTQATALFCFRLRSKQDLDAFIEETSAVLDKKRLMQLYKEATSIAYGFLYVNLQATSAEEMFWLKFDYPLLK